MGKLVVSLDGVVIKEVQITKDKTTLGRRPYNDIVIDNLAVSGEHAVLQMVGADVFIEDLNSTNGTYINGKAIKKQLLTHNDTVEIGKYKIKFLVDETGDYEKTMIMRPPAAAASAQGSAIGPGFGGLSSAAQPAASSRGVPARSTIASVRSASSMKSR
jgi:predicted component of type VI protein secretion system